MGGGAANMVWAKAGKEKSRNADTLRENTFMGHLEEE